MTKTVDIEQINNSIQAVIALTQNGDEVVVEENGSPIVRVIPYAEDSEPSPQKRIMGLGSGKGYFMSDDFDEELPAEFWGFDEEL